MGIRCNAIGLYWAMRMTNDFSRYSFHQLQISGDNKSADLQNDLKIKSFELERTQMVYEETIRNLKKSQLENETLTQKCEVTNLLLCV